jgi:hypothetical protein
MSRYELWSDNSLKFCEFELAGTAVIVRQGNRPTRGGPNKGQSTTKPFSSPDKARVAYEDLIAARLGTGKWRPPTLSDRALIRIRSKKSSDARLRQLEEAARKSSRIQMQFALALPDEVVTVVIEIGVSRLRILFDDTRRKHGSVPSNLDGALSETEHRFPRAKLLLGKIVVKTWKCPLKPRAVAQILTSVLAERFETVEIPVEPKRPRADIGEAPDSSAVPARRPTDWPETDIRLELQVQRMHFTPDGRYLVMLLGPAPFPAASYAIEIWERGATKPLRVIKLPRTGGVHGLAVSPDGKYLVTGYQGLRIHEVPSGRLVGYLEGHRSRLGGAVLDVACSPDGSLVASGSQDNMIVRRSGGRFRYAA